MPWLWSNPSASNATPAALTSGARLEAPNISGVLSAILQNRQKQQESQERSTENITNSVTGLMKQREQDQNAGALSSFMQSGMTDQSDALINPDQQKLIEHMSPEGRLAAMNWLQKTQEQTHQDEIESALKDAQTKAYNAHGNYWNNKGNNGVTDRRAMLDAQAREAAAQQEILNATGAEKKDLSKIVSSIGAYQPGAANVPGTAANVFPKLGTHPAIKDASQGDYKQSVLDAVSRYTKALKDVQSLGVSPQPGGASAGNNINAQVAQIQAAFKSGQMSRADAAKALNALGIQGD